MNKEQIPSLSKYVESLKSKLSDTDVPVKHKHRPEAYRDFLQRELKKASTKLEALKLLASESKRG